MSPYGWRAVTAVLGIGLLIAAVGIAGVVILHSENIALTCLTALGGLISTFLMYKSKNGNGQPKEEVQ